MDKKEKIYIGSDHAGFALKEEMKRWLDQQKISYEDMGNLVYDKDDDYPDFAAKVARKVVREKTPGILFCGSGEGVCIAANKVNGARAVNPYDVEKTRFARDHEDANILCLAGGASMTPQQGFSIGKAGRMIKVFLETPFSGEERHVRRLNKIKKLEGYSEGKQ